MKKFVLVPESKYKQTLNTVEHRNRDVLQSITHPEQREMLKRYQVAQSILHDPQRPTDEKMDEYREAMQEFAMLRDRMRSTLPPPQQPDAKKPRVDEEVKEDGIPSALKILPQNQQKNAMKLINTLRERGDDTVTWTKDGEVKIRGEPLTGTNIIDLVGDVVRSASSKSSAPQRERFLNALAEANVPETLVKNKKALERYRQIKNNVGDAVASAASNVESEDEVSSTTTKRARATSMTKSTRKKASSPSSIDWNAPV